MSAAADPVDLLARAAADGHTWLPRTLLDPAVPSAAMAAAVGGGSVVEVDVASGASESGWAAADVAEVEDLLAEGLGELSSHGRLAVVRGPRGGRRMRAVDLLRSQASDRSAHVVVADDADRLDLDAALQVVEEAPDDALLLLAGDADALGPAGPGQAFLDVVDSGVCPAVEAGSDDEPPGSGLAALRAALRDGRLTAPVADDRSFVVVPVTEDAEALRRAVQVATVSIPRAFARSGAEVAVLCPQVRGAAGRDAVATTLQDAGAVAIEVLTVHDAAGRRWPAAVLVLPPSSAGVLDRALLVSVAEAAQQHLSVVHGVGADLSRAVATRPRRTRRTRLAALLRAAAGAVDPPPTGARG